MRTAFLLAAAVLILNPLQVLHPAANPDLVLLEIDWTPDPPTVGDAVHFTVPVQNQGDMDTPSWAGVCVGLLIEGFQIEFDCVDGIAQGATEIFDFYWGATAGNHTVRAVADYGDYVPESDEDNNTREEPLCIAPGAPDLSSPPDDSSTCDATPYFDWPSVSGATSYRIQADDSSDFASPTIDATTSNSDYTPGTPLGPGTYYWRVRASHSCADGPWSPVWSVTVLSTPGTPSPSSPPDSSTTDDDTPTFAWASASGATSYRIQVDDDPAFSSPEIDQATTDPSYTPDNGLADDVYYWRAQASNACGPGPWSPTWSLTVDTPCPTPSAPTLSSPADGSTTDDDTPTFTWTSASGVTSYRIQVDDDAGFSSPEIDQATTDPSHTPDSVLADGVYYWRVQASNACGDSPWSATWSLTVITYCPTPPAPTLSSPPDGSTTSDDTPTFAWASASGATSYRIQVDDDPAFSSPEIDQATTDPSYTPDNGLADDVYYWRVQASNACGDSPWSAAWSLTVDTPCPTPSAPTLSSPADGNTTGDDTPTFAWASAGGATSYRIQVDDDPAFSSPEVDQTTSSTTYTPGSALADGAYHWRVQASNACGPGPWSPTWDLTVDTPCPTPPAPTLSSPPDGSTTADDSPTFAWTSAGGAISYRIQVDDDPAFSSPEVDQATSGTTYTPDSALADGTYHWRVQASNACGDSPWSTAWSLTVDTYCPTPPAPALSSPPDGSTTGDDTPTFAWTGAGEATSYRIQVDDDPAFSSPEVDQATSGTTYTPASALADGTYHWRVQDSNGCGDSSWSAAWSLTVDTPCPTPPAPALSSPPDGSTTGDDTPTFAWTSASGATSYRVQVDDDAAFSSPEVDQATSATAYTPASALADGTYHWRVRASNTCGDSPWSPTWDLTVDTPCPTPSAPTLSSPPDSSTTGDDTPTFAWTSASGATSYRIQVDDDADFSSPEINQATSSTTYTPSSALADGTYHWRVRASNACGSGPWSATWSLTVDTPCPTPSAPGLSSPPDGSTTGDDTPTFDWASASGATSYRIQVDDDANFSSPQADQATSSTAYTPGSALADGTYHWRVRASNTCGDSPWSPTWDLTVDTPCPTPSAPTLSSPPDGSTTGDDTPTFAWASMSGATSYRIQVDDDPAFSSPEVDQATSSTAYTPGSALADGTYHWRVRASNACGSGPWSATWSLTVDTPCPTPSAPGLSSPPDGSTTGDDTPTFAWTSASGATSYRIQVDDDPAFSSPQINQATSSNTYTPASALADGTYHWRVQASNTCGDSPWSAPWQFAVDTSEPGRPQAILGVSPLRVRAGAESVRFDGSASFDPDGTVVRYLFDFGDGTAPMWIEQPARYHTYDRPGEYQARLKVQDDLGLISAWSASQVVTVEDLPPDERAPDIWNVGLSPTPIYVNGCTGSITATVTCRVEDSSDLAYAILRYALGSELYDGTLMTPVADHVYRANVGDFEQGGTLHYYIETADAHSHYTRTSTYSTVVAECPQASADLRLVDVAWSPPQPVTLSSMNLTLTLQNDGPGPFVPADGNYAVELGVDDGLVLGVPVPLRLSFSTEVESHRSRMTPAVLERLSPGQSIAVMVRRIRLPQPVVNGTLDVRFIPADAERNPGNNAVQVPFAVAEDPQHPADCFTTAARIYSSFLPDDLLTSPLAAALDGYLGCQDEPVCQAATLAEFFEATLATALQQWAAGAGDVGPTAVLAILDRLWQAAADGPGCDAWLASVIGRVIASLHLDQSGFAANAIVVHAAAYPLVRNRAGQLAGFADSGENLNQIPGSRVSQTADSRIILVPGSDLETIRLRGIGYGTASLEITLARADGSAVMLTYRNLPLTPQTIAILNLDTPGGGWILELDLDGDGVVDETRRPDTLETWQPHWIYLPLIWSDIP